MTLLRLLSGRWDRLGALVAAVAGVIAIILGWFGVSGQALPSAQLPYLASGAIFGLFFMAVAATLWLSADMRDEWHKLDEIHRDIRSLDLPIDGLDAETTLLERRGDEADDLAVPVPRAQVRRSRRS